MRPHYVYYRSMKLDTYIRDRGLTSEQFGRDAGIPSKQAIHNYRHGLRFPTPRNLRLIRLATNGLVTADDFVDQHVGSDLNYHTREAA